MLSAVDTAVDVHARVSDLYSAPYNQVTEQLRLTIEIVKERQESELIQQQGLRSAAQRRRRAADQDARGCPDARRFG